MINCGFLFGDKGCIGLVVLFIDLDVVYVFVEVVNG